MAKTKKAPVASTTGFADKTGYLLAIGDQVRFEHSSSKHSGRHGILTAIHPRESQDIGPVATVEFLYDSHWQASPAMPAFEENLTFISREAFAVGERAKVEYEQGDNYTSRDHAYTGHEGRIARIVPNAPFPDIILLEFNDPNLEDCEFQATDLLRTALAEPVSGTQVVPELTPEPVYTPTKMKLVLLADIVVTTNTRKVFDETALAELAESIKSQGIIAPITVRPHATEAGKFELVAGARRYRASKLAGQVSIPAVIRSLTDREFLEVQLLENLQRVDVRPSDEAEAFARLKSSHLSFEEIAQRVGKTPKFVSQRTELVKLLPFWFDLLEAGKLALVAAHELARLPAHSQLAVKHKVEENPQHYGGSYSKSDVRTIIERDVLRDLDKAPWAKDDALLVPSAGPCTACPKRSSMQGLLFASKSGKDLCLDAGCFGLKQAAVVERRLAELTAELGKTPLRVSSSYYPEKALRDAGVISSSDYFSGKEGQAGSVPALIMDGADAGKVKWISPRSGVKSNSPELVAAEKARQAAQIRKDRIKKTHRLLLAERLTNDLPAALADEKEVAHGTLDFFILDELQGKASAKLEYLKKHLGWEPTPEALKDDWNTYDSLGFRPWKSWLISKLDELGFTEKLNLFFILKVRHRMDHEYEDLQFNIAKLIGEQYDVVATEAEAAVQLRYYTPKGKKQEVAA